MSCVSVLTTIDRGSTGSRGSFDPPLLEVGGQAMLFDPPLALFGSSVLRFFGMYPAMGVALYRRGAMDNLAR